MRKKFFKDTQYEIYEDGRCFSHKSNKFLAPHKIGKYLYYGLYINNKRVDYKIHRMVAEAFIPNEDINKTIVIHIDGNKTNNNVNNLRWVSAQENSIHAIDSGLKPSSNQNGIFYSQDLENERWKEIKDFPNYLVSDKGRVMNKNTKRLLKPENRNGYLSVNLWSKNKGHHKLIHRLVYYSFAEDGNDDLDTFVINHTDGDKSNNRLDNLEKITKSENNLHAVYVIETNKSAKPVGQFSLEDEFLKSYPSIAEAMRQTKINNIGRAIKNNKTAGNYKWHFI